MSECSSQKDFASVRVSEDPDLLSFAVLHVAPWKDSVFIQFMTHRWTDVSQYVRSGVPMGACERLSWIIFFKRPVHHQPTAGQFNWDQTPAVG